MTTRCAQLILTVRTDDRLCMHFGPVRLERMTSPITPMTCTSALMTRMFLWWRHSVIQIYVITLTHLHTLCGVQKLVFHEVYLLEIPLPHYFMIGWRMVLLKIIRPVMYSSLPIGIKAAHFCTIFEPMVFHIPGFGTFWLHKQVDDSNACFVVRLKGVSFSGCGWSMAMRVFLVGTIVCPSKNTPLVSASAAEATTFFSVWQAARIGTFSLVWACQWVVGDHWDKNHQRCGYGLWEGIGRRNPCHHGGSCRLHGSRWRS